MKSSQIYSRFAQNPEKQFFSLKCCFLKEPQKSPNILATFVRIFFDKKFKKSPKLYFFLVRCSSVSISVTLISPNLVSLMSHLNCLIFSQNFCINLLLFLVRCSSETFSVCLLSPKMFSFTSLYSFFLSLLLYFQFVR